MIAGAATGMLFASAPAQAESVAFAPAAGSPFAVHDSPIAIGRGDFNGDGDIDLAVANVNSSDVSVLLGGAGGSFAPRTDYAVGAVPLSVAVGDFNSDNDPDLAVAFEGEGLAPGGVSVLLGGPGGSFGARTDFAAGDEPRAVATGDFDRDGALDLAVASTESRDINILRGSGNGSFGAPTSLPPAPDPGQFQFDDPYAIAVGDFNKDGDLDLVVANFFLDKVSVLTGGPGASFGTPISFDVASRPLALALGDGDGDLDLAIASLGGPSVSVLLGGAGASFGARKDYEAGFSPESIAVAQIDADADPDLVVGTQYAQQIPGTVAVLLGGAGGSFGVADHFEAGFAPAPVAPGDFDRDGRTDIAAGDIGSDVVSVLLQIAAQRSDLIASRTVSGKEQLVRFAPDAPAALDVYSVQGLTTGDVIDGLDTRPCTGQLWGKGRKGKSNQLYTFSLDATTKVATATRRGARWNTLSASPMGFDFNPVTDRIRVVAPDSNENLRISAGPGPPPCPLGARSELPPGALVSRDPNLFYNRGNPDTEIPPDRFAGRNPDIVAAAFSGSAIGAPPTRTALFDIDSTLNSLARQDPDGSELNTVGLLGVDTTTNVGFDLVSDATGVDRGYAALQRPGSSRSELFRIELVGGRRADRQHRHGAGRQGAHLAAQPVASGRTASATDGAAIMAAPLCVPRPDRTTGGRGREDRSVPA